MHIRFFLAAIWILYATALPACRVKMPEIKPEMPPVSHDIWNGLLKKHVRPDGMVEYKGFVKDSALFNKYLNILSASHPQPAWSRADQMAYWINAYNAFTVKLIVDHYPVQSIKDIKKGIPFVNTVWDIKFIQIQGQTYDLNNIEHGILRPQFKDARIHAAINCASFSCPRLLNEAFSAQKLEQQLEAVTRSFINDPQRNKVSADKAELSAIFNWFGGDFKRDAGSVRAFVNRYAHTKISETAVISYLDYDWSLNDVK